MTSQNFPLALMSKNIKRETSGEVDDSPTIYNARDYNRHHRELLAIQKALIGKGLASGTGLLGKFYQILNAFRNMSNNGSLAQYSGTIRRGESVQIPDHLIHTDTTRAAILASDTTIPVLSTIGFAKSGVITKFNAIDPYASFGKVKTMSSYEIIEYSGITDTSFTGCTRAVEGTAQDVADGDLAVIMAGRASIMFSQKTWEQRPGTGLPFVVTIAHDQALNVSVNDAVNIEIVYTLLVSGYFTGVNVDPTGI